MRFRSTNRPPSYMSRPFQIRMILMIVSLGLVAFAIKVTSRPSFWAGMFPDDPEAAQTEEETSAENETQAGLDGIPRVQMDEVLIAQTDETGSSEPSDVPPEEEEAEAPVVESSLPTLPDQPQVESLQIDPARFEPVEDFSLHVTPEESDAFFYTIYHAGQIPLKQLEQAGQENVSFMALRTQPEFYRGQVITIEGELRRNENIEADQNAYGINEFYSAWIITPTSDNIPYRVVALHEDEGLPFGQLIEESVPVRVSGYFFKIQSYATKGGEPQMSPLLIARRIKAAPKVSRPKSLIEESNPIRWLFVFFCVVFAIAVWSAYRSTIGAKRMRSQRKEMLESDGDLSDLQGQESIDPGEELRKLREEE